MLQSEPGLRHQPHGRHRHRKPRREGGSVDVSPVSSRSLPVRGRCAAPRTSCARPRNSPWSTAATSPCTSAPRWRWQRRCTNWASPRSPRPCALRGRRHGNPLVKRLALAAGPDDLADRCGPWGPLSERSARRILDRGHRCARPLNERLAAESFRGRPIAHPSAGEILRTPAPASGSRGHRCAEARHRPKAHGGPWRKRYYLEAVGEAEVIVGQEAIRITVPIRVALRKRAVAPLGCNR